MFLLVALSIERRDRFRRVWRHSINDARMTLLQAAQEAEKDVRHFARIVDGEAHALDVLTKQPDAFWRALAENLVLEFGISRRARLAAKLARLTIGTRRQLRIHAQKAKRAV